MKKIDTRKRCGDRSALFVHVIAARRNVGIVADQRERLRARRQSAPGEIRVAVAGELDMCARIDCTERELGGNHAAIGESRCAELHRELLRTASNAAESSCRSTAVARSALSMLAARGSACRWRRDRGSAARSAGGS